MDRPGFENDLTQKVGQKEQRKIKARRQEGHSIWYGLGMFGLVGWSIAVPTLIGIAIGVWLDRRWPQLFSFTLICLSLGVVIGCAIAWYWVRRESLWDDLDNGPSSSNTEARQPENQS